VLTLGLFSGMKSGDEIGILAVGECPRNQAGVRPEIDGIPIRLPDEIPVPSSRVP
jgi:hypothetical protein